MGRPRRQLRDPNLAVGVVEQGGAQIGPISIVPVFRMNPITVDPVFWLAFHQDHIEAAVGPEESDEQSLFVAQARNFGAKVASVPNGGFRETGTAVKMKREGMATGFPDLIVARGIPATLGPEWEAAKVNRLKKPETWDEKFRAIWQQMPVAIEFKRRHGSLDDIKIEQLAWLEELTNSGWRVAVAYGSAAGFGWLSHLGFYTPPIR
jgi:hypothetical protein